jgi:hypothetical protein
VTDRGLDRDQTDDGGVDVHLGQSNGGHAVLSAQHERDVVISEQPQPDERRAEAPAVRPLMAQRDFELCWCDAPFAQQQLTESDSHDPSRPLRGLNL